MSYTKPLTKYIKNTIEGGAVREKNHVNDRLIPMIAEIEQNRGIDAAGEHTHTCSKGVKSRNR